MLGLLGTYYAATDGVLMAMASAVIPAELRSSGLAWLTTVTVRRQARPPPWSSGGCGSGGLPDTRRVVLPRRDGGRRSRSPSSSSSARRPAPRCRPNDDRPREDHRPRRALPSTEPPAPKGDRWRLFGFIALCVVCVAVAVGYVVGQGGPSRSASSTPPGPWRPGRPSAADLMAQPHIVVRDMAAGQAGYAGVVPLERARRRPGRHRPGLRPALHGRRQRDLPVRPRRHHQPLQGRVLRARLPGAGRRARCPACRAGPGCRPTGSTGRRPCS